MTRIGIKRLAAGLASLRGASRRSSTGVVFLPLCCDIDEVFEKYGDMDEYPPTDDERVILIVLEESYQIDDLADNPTKFTGAKSIYLLGGREDHVTIDGGSIRLGTGWGSNLYVERIRFTGEDGGVTADGNDGAAHIYNSIFEGKAGNEAAAVSERVAEIIDSEFRDNTADEDGGAVYAESTGGEFDQQQHDLLIEGSHFEGNKAGDDGGAVRKVGRGEEIHIHDSTFVDNEALYGGAVRSQGGRTIENSEFRDNQATRQASYGGAALFGFGEGDIGLEVRDSEFTGNDTSTAAGTNSAGGAIAARKNPDNPEEIDLTIEIHDSTFEENASLDGGAVAVTRDDVHNEYPVDIKSFDSTYVDNDGFPRLYSRDGDVEQEGSTDE